MTNLWDKILSKSGLPECRSIAEHICTALNSISDYIIKTEDEIIVDLFETDQLIAEIQKEEYIHVVVSENETVKIEIEKEECLEIDVSEDTDDLKINNC